MGLSKKRSGASVVPIEAFKEIGGFARAGRTSSKVHACETGKIA
jgi:hypothetical protein